MIPKKEGDQGLECCSIEDPSPTTPLSITTFTQQTSSHHKPPSQAAVGPKSSAANLPTLPFIYSKKAQSCNAGDGTPQCAGTYLGKLNDNFSAAENSQKL